MAAEFPIVWGPLNPLDFDRTDEFKIPFTFHFAAAGPPVGPEPPNPVEERKRIVAEALVTSIRETNQDFYPRYTAAGLPADQVEQLRNEEEDTIARLLNIHMDDATPATEPPSPHAREIARTAFFVNRSAQTDLVAAARNNRRKKEVRDRQHTELMALVTPYLNVGQPRHIVRETPPPPPPAPPLHRRAVDRVRQIEITEDRRKHIGCGIAALVAAGFVVWAGIQIANDIQHTHTSHTYPASQCFEAPAGTVVSGSTISIGADNQNQKPLNTDTSVGVVLLVNKPTTVCAGSLPMTATFADGDTDAIAQQIAQDRADLRSNGCADNNGCRRVVNDTFS